MFSTAKVYIAVITIAVLATTLFAVPRDIDTPYRPDGSFARGERGTLDEDENQLRYVKTTDYGASWNLAQAGNLSVFSPTYGAFGDFSGVVNANGELVFLINLENAQTPGIYAMVGPNFVPVSVNPEGSNDYSYGYSAGGHTDVARAPDGSLVGVFWGANAAGANTLWGCKSTNNGANWWAWVVATEPALAPRNEADVSHLFKLPDRVHNQWAWALYQEPSDNGWDMKTIRFDHTTTNMGSVVTVNNDYAGHPFSFMFGGCKPIAYDAEANYIYLAFRNHDATGILAYYSNDAGATYQSAYELIDPLHRYPHVAVRPADDVPFLVYGQTVGSLLPGEDQCVFYTFDELGYNGGSWVEPSAFQCQTLFDDNTAGYNSIYVPQVWWWSATQGVAKFDGYTNFLSGEIIRTSRTADGGASWVDYGTRAHYVDNQYNAGTMQISELVGGENGIAYVIFSAAPGITDETPPEVGPMELVSSPLGLGPYVVRAFYDDNIGIDTVGNSNGPWVNWRPSEGGADTYVNEDSTLLTVPERQTGWYYFTIPSDPFGQPLQTGDSVWFYCDGYDLSGNYNAAALQIIVAGVAWLDIFTPPQGQVSSFALHANYPNPFNPTTTIAFDLPSDELVTLKIYNTVGQTVRTLMSNDLVGAGTHQINFDASDLSTGIYFYRLTAGDFTSTRKMVLVK